MRAAVLGCLTIVAIAACAPPPAGRATRSEATSGNSAPKVLTVAVNKEPFTIQGFTQGGASSGRGNTESNFVHNQLVVQDDGDALRPQLAVEVPSIERGTWRINPDASMDMTWRL